MLLIDAIRLNPAKSNELMTICKALRWLVWRIWFLVYYLQLVPQQELELVRALGLLGSELELGQGLQH